MATAAINNPALNLRQVTADISRSVENLRLREQGPYERGLTTQTETEAQQNQAVFGGYTVTYLAPQAVYAIQSFVSGNDEVEEQSRGNVFRDAEQTETGRKPELSADETDGISFQDELFALQNNNDYAGAARAYALNGGTSGNLVVTAGGEGLISGGFGYAAAAYDYVFNINSQPQILIDYMHEYNRSFDFRI